MRGWTGGADTGGACGADPGAWRGADRSQGMPNNIPFIRWMNQASIQASQIPLGMGRRVHPRGGLRLLNCGLDLFRAVCGRGRNTTVSDLPARISHYVVPPYPAGCLRQLPPLPSSPAVPIRALSLMRLSAEDSERMAALLRRPNQFSVPQAVCISPPANVAARLATAVAEGPDQAGQARKGGGGFLGAGENPSSMAGTAVCRHTPEVGAPCVSAHAGICTGGVGQPAFLP